MAVVVIMGILATLGFAGLSKHRTASRSIEAIAMIQSIRAAQERWRAEYMVYLNVSTDAGGWYPRDPRGADLANTMQAFFYPSGDTTHADSGRWLALRPTVAGPVLFGYRTHAGHAGTDPPEVGEAALGIDWPTPTNSWYTIEATGDVDWDGQHSYYVASSFNDSIVRYRDGE